ncbi:MAG TPA: hypothetical protein VM100_12520 [Longimicrobiales bacterium]|nr:hypothetical protein [Longimicrobiales bacterium]
MLFRRDPRKVEEEIENRIRNLLMRCDERIPGADAAAYNAGGDLYAEAGLRDRALGYYGDAIDAYLKVERWDAAAGICRKVLRLSPQSVRTRCTLAWLAIGKGHLGEAQKLIRDYARAAAGAGRDNLAVAQLRRMGDAAALESVRQAVAEALLELGADRMADHFFGLVNRSRNLPPRSTPTPEMLWSAVRHAALLGPAQLAN